MKTLIILTLSVLVLICSCFQADTILFPEDKKVSDENFPLQIDNWWKYLDQSLVKSTDDAPYKYFKYLVEDIIFVENEKAYLIGVYYFDKISEKQIAKLIWLYDESDSLMKEYKIIDGIVIKNYALKLPDKLNNKIIWGYYETEFIAQEAIDNYNALKYKLTKQKEDHYYLFALGVGFIKLDNKILKDYFIQ